MGGLHLCVQQGCTATTTSSAAAGSHPVLSLDLHRQQASILLFNWEVQVLYSILTRRIW